MREGGCEAEDGPAIERKDVVPFPGGVPAVVLCPCARLLPCGAIDPSMTTHTHIPPPATDGPFNYAQLIKMRPANTVRYF